MHVIRKICNRVAVMEAGRIVEQGNVMEVFTNPKQPVTKKFVDQVVSDTDLISLNYIVRSKLPGKVYDFILQEILQMMP